MRVDRKPVIVAANSMANLAHFRKPLFKALSERGTQTIALAPFGRGVNPPTETAIDIRIDRGGLKVWRDLGTLASFVRIFRRRRPAAVLSFTPKANVYGGLAARIARVPFIPTVTGLGTAFLRGGIPRWVQWRLYRLAFARSPTVFFQNEEDANMFVQGGLVSTDRAIVVPGSGIDLAAFAATPLPVEDRISFVFVGRLLADKGIRELMAAAQLLQSRDVAFELIVVGSVDPGNPSSVSTNEVELWKSQGLARFVGQQGDVRPLIRQAHAVVLPSYREGLPRTLLEASAMGRPMIATDVAGCRSVVRHGENGLLCKPRDAAALAEVMTSFLGLSDLEKSSMGRAARQIAENEFDERRVVKQYLDALDRLGLR